jgi:hypothetical protein
VGDPSRFRAFMRLLGSVSERRGIRMDDRLLTLDR